MFLRRIAVPSVRTSAPVVLSETFWNAFRNGSSFKRCVIQTCATQAVCAQHQLSERKLEKHEITKPLFPAVNGDFKRHFSTGTSLAQQEETKDKSPEGEEAEAANDDDGEDAKSEKPSRFDRNKRGQGQGEVDGMRQLNMDRTQVISVETSIRYMKSQAYKDTYGDTPIWALHRRNFPGQFAPKKTRKRCIRKGELTSKNPCPICRDEYLVIDYRNIDLLKQFISPYNGETLGYDKTNVCRMKHLNLLVEIDKAKDYGLITFDVPFREYDYKEYEELFKSYNQQ